MRHFDKNLITKQLRFLQFPDVADAMILRRRYGAIASPLRCNRVAVTVKWHHRYGEIATRLQCNGKNFWPITDRRHFQRAKGYPFFALFDPVSKC